MSFFHFYLRNRKAIIPTVAQTEEGFYIDIEPVSIVDVDDFEKLKAALLSALERENPSIPTPQAADEPGSVVLDKVGIRRWEAFERQSLLYTIHGGTESISLYVTGRGANGMWVRQSENQKTFPLDTPLDEIVQAVWDDMKKQPEMRKTEPTLPMLLPPPKKD